MCHCINSLTNGQPADHNISLCSFEVLVIVRTRIMGGYLNKAIHGTVSIGFIRYIRHKTCHDVIEISLHESMILCKFCGIASYSTPI